MYYNIVIINIDINNLYFRLVLLLLIVFVFVLPKIKLISLHCYFRAQEVLRSLSFSDQPMTLFKCTHVTHSPMSFQCLSHPWH